MGNPIEFRELLVKMHTERMTSRWGAYSYNHKKPIWNGISEVGKTILINGEAGIGDELFGAKFAHNFVERGMKVVFATNYWSSYNVIARIKSIDNRTRINIKFSLFIK